MVPGEVYAITIELFPIANLFCRGHRLRLDISSSNFPHFDVNPNSGEPEGAVAAAAHRPQPRLRRGRPTLAHPVADHSVNTLLPAPLQPTAALGASCPFAWAPANGTRHRRPWCEAARRE
jgi:predicted acyl esterase